MIRELGNGGLVPVTEVALMPCTRSVRLRAREDPVVAQAKGLPNQSLSILAQLAGWSSDISAIGRDIPDDCRVGA